MRIGLFVNAVSTLDRHLYRELVRGIRERGWTLDQSYGLHFPVERLEPGALDAYVAWVQGPRDVGRIVKSGVPTVNFTYLLPTPELHQVTHNQREVGARAAEHLIGLGIQSVVTIAYSGPAYGHERIAGFHERWNLERPPAQEIITRNLHRINSESFLKRWQKLKPVDALFCVSDEIAMFSINALESIDIHVPQDLAVVGVGHEEIHSLCLGRGITSVGLDHHGIAVGIFEALDKIAKNPSVKPKLYQVPPLDVFPGETARRPLPNHPGLRAAADVLSQNDLRNVDLDLLANTAGMSRRNFERQFKDATGQPPGAAIREARIGLARRYLTEPSMTIEDIADLCGYADRHHFSVRFKADVGQTPAAYRDQMRSLDY